MRLNPGYNFFRLIAMRMVLVLAILLAEAAAQYPYGIFAPPTYGDWNDFDRGDRFDTDNRFDMSDRFDAGDRFGDRYDAGDRFDTDFGNRFDRDFDNRGNDFGYW